MMISPRSLVAAFLDLVIRPLANLLDAAQDVDWEDE